MKLPPNAFPDQTLYLRSYLEQNDIKDWSLLKFDMALVDKYPGISRKVAHTYVAHDLSIIKRLYPEKECIQKTVNSIHKDLGKRKKPQAVEDFWKKLKPSYEKKVLEKKIKMVDFENASLDLASTVVSDMAKKKRATDSSVPAIQTRKKGRTSSSDPGESSSAPTDSNVMSSASKAAKDRHRTTANGPESENDETRIEEIDNVFVKSNPLSVGTVIKQQALLIHHHLYTQNKTLTTRQRKIMVAGLSSILDLADNSTSSQRALFSDDDWKSLVDFFKKKYPVRASMMPKALDNAWSIVAGVSKNSLESGQSFLAKSLANHGAFTKEHRNILKIMEHILDVIENYQYLLQKASKPGLYTEQDYYQMLWSRIFDLLFRSSVVRVKAGESIPIVGTLNKEKQYPGQEQALGFKIDARLLVDVDEVEYDLAAIEVAKDDHDKKIISDMGKLIREGKDDLDDLIKNLADDNRGEISSLIFQIAGANCNISSVHLASDGLYIVREWHAFSLPMSPESLEDFRGTLEMLLYVKEHIHGLANRIVEAKSKRNDITQNLGRFVEDGVSEQLHWVRDTWYSPNRDDHRASTPPPFMFASAGRQNPRSLLAYANDSHDECEDQGASTEDPPVFPDEFGYIQQKDGTWMNIYTKEVTAYRLHQNDDNYENPN